MENQFTTERASIALILATLLTACTTGPSAATPEAVQFRPEQLAVTQAGYGPSARYVYCEMGSCPAPTPKTLTVPVAASPAKLSAPRPVTEIIHVSFDLNSPRISKADELSLVRTASQYPGGDIEIIARSDFVGTTAAKIKVAKARAKAMRSIVANQTQGARITVRREVAGPTHVAKVDQAQQRKGTVRFTRPIDVHLKGTPK